MLRSGNTIDMLARAFGEAGARLLEDLTADWRGFGNDPAAFALLEPAIRSFLDDGENSLVAALSRQGVLANARIEGAAHDFFARFRTNIDAEFSLKRDKLAMRAQPTPDRTPARVPCPPPSPTGRRPAEFWDEAWAVVSAALYDGTLIPKRQADIERFMSEWIEGSGYTAAPSGVRTRARRLWAKVKPSAT